MSIKRGYPRSLTIHAEGLKQKQLFGKQKIFAKKLESIFDVRLTFHNGAINVYGNKKNSNRIADFLKKLIEHLKIGGNDIDRFLKNYLEKHVDINEESASFISPKTPNHKIYKDSISNNILTFVTGPAGSGKTYIAVGEAAQMLKEGKIRKIILVRPIIEAGEKLGYLPGNIQEKVDPYMRPIYDALGDFYGHKQIKSFIDEGVIEISPLAFMRGRTFKDCFVILDEAQNITISQMKMFLTRIGDNTKVVVNGDISQIDLPENMKSGLIDAISILLNIENIGIVELDDSDIMRHKIVKEIVNKYQEREKY